MLMRFDPGGVEPSLLNSVNRIRDGLEQRHEPVRGRQCDVPDSTGRFVPIIRRDAWDGQF